MSLIADKWVRIMCDFGADGVWDKEGVGCSPKEMPVSEELVARLGAWQEIYDNESPTPADEDDERPAFDDVAFSLEGLAIARAVKAALPDWTVIYHDEAKANKIRVDIEKNRSFFEYEILLDDKEGEDDR